MMLSIRTYKVRRTDRSPIYKTYRYPAFDTAADGDNLQEKFNNAFMGLREQIDEDRKHNEMDKYENIVIADVWLS